MPSEASRSSVSTASRQWPEGQTTSLMHSLKPLTHGALWHVACAPASVLMVVGQASSTFETPSRQQMEASQSSLVVQLNATPAQAMLQASSCEVTQQLLAQALGQCNGMPWKSQPPDASDPIAVSEASASDGGLASASKVASIEASSTWR